MELCAVSAVGLAAALSIASCLLPEGEGGRAGRGALAVLFAAAILLPLVLSLKNLDFSAAVPAVSIENGTPLYREYGEDAFAAGIARSVEQTFSLGGGSVSVSLSDFDFSAMRAGGATVLLPRSAGGVDPLRVAEHVRGCGVEVCEVEFAF